MSSESLQVPVSQSEILEAAQDKICRVCGDKALGYNFNAITCESCKAFFRRNALKNKEFKCPFKQKCEITPITRRFCQLCRLVKCFEIGMKKEYIMSDDDKREKWKKIVKNKATKKRPITAETVEDTRNDIKEPKQKQKRLENENEIEDEGYDDNDEGAAEEKLKKLPKDKLVKVDFQNVASSSSQKVHKKKQANDVLNWNQRSNPFPSPSLPELSSSDEVPLMESRTCNVFEDGTGTNQSRSVEIYRVSKPTEKKSLLTPENNGHVDSSIIKIILDSEFSKPSEVYTNSALSKQVNENEKVCSFDDSRKGPPEEKNEAVLYERDIFEFVNSKKKILVECTKDGRNFIVINKDALMDKCEGEIIAEKLRPEIVRSSENLSHLSSLVNRRLSDSSCSPLRKNISEDIFQDNNSRTSSPCLTNSIDSILSEAIKLEYEAYTSMNTRINSRELNDAERAKLNELIVANEALMVPLEDDLSGGDYGFSAIVDCGPSVLVDVLNLTAVAIRRLIKMSKKINAFKNMCQDDQIALLKGGCTEMMILRSAMTYDPDRDSWKIPQSKEKLMNIKVDILKEAGGRVFEEHQRFLQTFDPKWRNDENIMIILSAITLFTPDRPRVVHYDVIKLEQNSYYFLLRRYLESVYQGCEAKLTFLKLIHKISELHKLNEDHVRVYLDANPREIEPLLIEIFDLKPH